MIEFILFIIGVIIGILFTFLYYRAEVIKLGSEIGQKIFEEKKAELEKSFEEKYKILLEEWKIKSEKELREDALERSRAVLKGALAEQLAPIFKIFGHNPSDARFIGDPVDYIIFDGYTEVKERIEDKPITIILAEVKTGEATLTYEQRRIKEGIEKGLVKFEIIRI
jgi:predicted Holliday junction resolvase-like endonuclease